MQKWSIAKVREISPDIIIHAAAFTKVDEAEVKPRTAFLTNSIGTRNMAKAAADCGAKLVYISTDYVFDGQKGKPYSNQIDLIPLMFMEFLSI